MRGFEPLVVASYYMWPIIVLMLTYVFLLTYWVEKVTYPRVCFLGAMLFVLSICLPVFAGGVGAVTSMSAGYYGGSNFDLAIAVGMAGGPILLVLSLVFLFISIAPQRRTPISTNISPQSSDPHPLDD